MSDKKTLFVISDIHGHFSAMKQALSDAGYDKTNENHLLIACGDYFDRGKENLNVLKYLDFIDNKILLRGNHEEMLLEIFETGRMKSHNFLNGTEETIKEFFGKYAIGPSNEIDFSGKTGTFNWVWKFMSDTQNYFETKNYVFVHGWVPVSRSLDSITVKENWRNSDENTWHDARWTRWVDMYGICKPFKDKTLVCGHYPTIFATKVDRNRKKDCADIFYGDGVIAIDGGTYTTGKVNVLVLEDWVI